MKNLSRSGVVAAIVLTLLSILGLVAYGATGDAFAAWSESARANVFRVSSTGDGYFSGAIYANDTVTCQTAGKGLRLKEGSNAVMGTATLSSGWVNVPTTAVGSTSRVFVSGQSTSGAVYVKSRVNGTSFAIYSTDNSDSGTAAWMIVQPAP